MKILLIPILITLHSSAISQTLNQNYLVTRKGDTIYCEIKSLKGKTIEYIENNKNLKRANIYNYLDANIVDDSIIDNPLGLEIEKPEPGYAHVYFYRPYVYTGSALPCNVEYNGKMFINIKTNTYFLHKVKAGQVHVYNWVNSKKNIIAINAIEGEIYFIRGSFAASFESWNHAPTSNPIATNGMNIFLDNPNIARHVILTMKKQSPSY